MAKRDSNFDEYAQLEEYASQEEIAQAKSELLACPDINNSITGTIISVSKNRAKSVMITTSDMVVDSQGLVFDAFVFAAANYVAQAAVNKEFSVLIGSKCFFYAPLKIGDILELEAQALFDESSKKRDVKVLGLVKEIKIFEATLQLVSTEEHVFKLKRPPLSTAGTRERQNNEEQTTRELEASEKSSSRTLKT